MLAPKRFAWQINLTALRETAIGTLTGLAELFTHLFTIVPEFEDSAMVARMSRNVT
jgi:hypothetical protein